MGHTNSTPNIGLPQFIGTDKPTWLGDINGAMSAIDTKVGSIDAAVATVDAKADNAVADASGAVTTATNAVNTAGAASTTATQANNLATQALTVANNTANLCTQSIVPSVTANTNAIGTLADLTTTDKSNLVNAINEVAQGGGGGGVGAWAQIAQQTGAVSVSLDLTDLTEILVSIDTEDKVYLNTVIPVSALSATAKNYVGGYSSGASTGVAAADVSNTAAIITSVKTDSTDKTSTAVMTIYGR